MNDGRTAHLLLLLQPGNPAYHTGLLKFLVDLPTSENSSQPKPEISFLGESNPVNVDNKD